VARLIYPPAALWWLILPLSLADCLPVAAAEYRATNLWQIEIGAKVDSTPAIAVDGTIIFGAFNSRLWAVNPDGSTKWKFRAGNEIRSSPAIGKDGTIYFGSRDRQLYAVTSNGKLKWKYPTGWWVDSSPAIATDGTIYVGSWDRKLHAVSPDGKGRWVFETDGFVASSPAISTNGVIYFGSYDGKLYAITAQGKKHWEFKTGGPILSSPALDWEGGIYFTSVDGFLYVLERDGRLRWKLKTGGSREGSVALGQGGRIYLGVTDEVWALNPDSTRRWARGKMETDATPIVLADGTVTIVWRNGQLQNIDPDYNHSWFYGIYTCGISSPTVSAEGVTYVAGQWSKFAALQTHVPIAKTSWPKFRGNLRNTGNLADNELGPPRSVAQGSAP
jgi:outer membrane protein assembly factor BamB